MAIDNKQFFGGLNSDDDDSLIPNGDYRYALNIRNSKQDGDSEGVIENVKGNTLISFPLWSGVFKTAGAYNDVLNNKVYYFLWNSNTQNAIMEYDSVLNSISLVLKGSALIFNDTDKIPEQNIWVIDGLMYFIDSDRVPRKINIERAKNGLVNGNDSDAISAIKAAPLYPPTTSFETDATIKQNSVRNKLFQFRYLWVYEDNEQSAWSPISKVALPIDEGQYRPSQFYPTEFNNNIRIDVNLGNGEVKRVKIAFREGNIGDFYLFKDIDKTKNIPLPSSYNFFNDAAYSSIDNNGAAGLRLFDWLPLKANTQSLIDGNIIAYGGVTEGYDPVEIDIDINKIEGTVPKTPAPDRANLITNQIAPINNYGVSLNSNSSAQDFRTFFDQTSGYNSIAGRSWFFRWSKGSIPNFSGISGYDSNTILNVTRSTSGNGWETGDGNAIWISEIHSLESLLKNDNQGNGTISPGARILLTLNVSWYDFENLSQRTKAFKFQEIANQTDNAYKILSRLKNQINLITYNDRNVNISFASKVGSYSRGYGDDINTVQGVNYGAIIDVQVKALVPPANVVGTLNLPIPCLYGTSSIDIDTYSSWTTKAFKTLKMGAKHSVGIVYSDQFGRSGLTNTLLNKSFYVEYPTERGIVNGLITDVVGLDISINHKAPLWAKSYQVVYTGNQTIQKIDTEEGYKGFIQLRLTGVTNASGINDALEASLSNLTTYNNGTSEVIGLSYGFTKGDRIRFLKDSNDDYYQSYVDVEVISYSQSTNSIIFKKPNISITGTPVVEIYTPKKTLSNEFYYEIGEAYQCDNGVHYGATNQIIDSSGTVTTPALIKLRDIGDVYLRYRITPMVTQVEDYNFSDYYDSDSWDKGRANIVDDNIKQTYRPTTIRYSKPYIPETNINGLSRFDDFSFEAYDQKYGAIMLMYSEDKRLNVFQQLKVGWVGVGQNVMYGNDGKAVGTLRNETKVLSDINYYVGEFGIGNNPESFAVYGNNKYFADAKRGAILRLSADGITPISEYKMHNFFTDILNLIDNSSSKYTILGVYDTKFGTYNVNIKNKDVNDTISFSESKNRWVEHFSYEPDYMVSNGTDIITFKDGGLYTHNTNGTYNYFYGNKHPAIIKIVSNVQPLSVKFYTNIIENSSHVWKLKSTDNNNEQTTSLEYVDFEDVEGVFKASLLMDENTPNVQNPLIEGDVIRGEHLVMTFENEDSDFVKLKNISVILSLSELTGR